LEHGVCPSHLHVCLAGAKLLDHPDQLTLSCERGSYRTAKMRQLNIFERLDGFTHSMSSPSSFQGWCSKVFPIDRVFRVPIIVHDRHTQERQGNKVVKLQIPSFIEASRQ
jgi:hypothetical protein